MELQYATPILTRDIVYKISVGNLLLLPDAGLQ